MPVTGGRPRPEPSSHTALPARTLWVARRKLVPRLRERGVSPPNDRSAFWPLRRPPTKGTPALLCGRAPAYQSCAPATTRQPPYLVRLLPCRVTAPGTRHSSFAIRNLRVA